MKTNRLIFLSVLIILTSVFLVSKVVNKPDKLQNSAAPSQTNSQGTVSIAVTLKNVSQPVFKIVLDTHSGSLDEDIAASSVLIDDQGNTKQPIAWEGNPAGGHHREGELKFQAITPGSKSITLKIRDIGEVSERSFTWNLE
ncbi:MAG: hypothetical protein Q7S45_03755 [Candidatus Curtissbacteria bacterium]|nr:hypothetical protein [Candidatus Curtissbacteria bacterium]